MLDQEQIPPMNQTQDILVETPEASDSENINVPPPQNDQDEESLAEDYSDVDYQEEETIIEDEEAPGAKYQVENEGSSGGTFAAIGDHAQLVNINYIVQLTHDARLEDNEKEDKAGTNDDFQGNLYQLIGSALASAHRNELLLVKTPTGKQNSEKKNRANEKEISQWSDEELANWYYDLNGYEQCYVQAAAVLHGASASEISRRADGLYVLLKMEREQIEVSAQPVGKTAPHYVSQVSLPPSLHDGSSAALYKRTHTFTQRVNEVERLFWHDVDLYGQSIFGLRLLDFLARELLSKGEHGKDFLARLEQWSFEGTEECRFFSARALGIFLWRQDAAALRLKAYKWARGQSLPGWRRTAMLLDGAYDIDQFHKQKEEHTTPSLVLILLKEWRERRPKSPEASNSQTDLCVRCAAANVYELIGKRFPEIALRELDQLLLSVSLETRNVDLLLAAITSAYVSLSWSGHIRRVLTHLAQMAEQSLSQPVRTQTFRERIVYRQQCEARLSVSLNAFFFIAATSLSEKSNMDPAAYEKPLSDPPIFPDPLGRDVILTGLLEGGSSSWFEPMVGLMAVAVAEKKRTYRLTAFDLIVQWIQDLQESTSGNGETTSISRMQSFLLKLDITFKTWQGEQKGNGKVQTPVHIVYQKQLRQWAQKKGIVGALSQEVLRQLDQSPSYKHEAQARCEHV